MAGLARSVAGGSANGPSASETREAGRLEGYRQGLQEARKEAAEQVARFEQLLDRLAEPFEGYEEQLEEEVLALVNVLTRQLVRREMHVDPTQVIGVIREAVKTLPNTTIDLRVRLHPEDAILVREYLKTEQGRRQWHIQEDPTLARGGCLVSNANTLVDATLETRLGRLVAELIGSERADDN